MLPDSTEALLHSYARRSKAISVRPNSCKGLKGPPKNHSGRGCAPCLTSSHIHDVPWCINVVQLLFYVLSFADRKLSQTQGISIVHRAYQARNSENTQKIRNSFAWRYCRDTVLEDLILWAVFKSMHRHSEGHGSVRRRSPVTASCDVNFGLYIGNVRSRETLLSHIVSLLRQDYNYSKLGASYAPSRQSLHYVPELPDRAVSVIWEAFCNGGSRHRNALAHSLWSVTLDRRLFGAGVVDVLMIWMYIHETSWN